MLKATFSTSGLGAFKAAEITEAQMRAAAMALNSTVEKTRLAVVDKLGREIVFPAGYLSPGAGRLGVSGIASPDKLEVRLRARARPTSLATFATNGVVGKKGGVTVTVKPGHPVLMNKAFLIRLRAGTENGGNLGLAMRLRPNESIRRSRGAVQMSSGLWLLYGPSVAQGFATYLDRGKLVAETEAMLQAEFDRFWRVTVNA